MQHRNPGGQTPSPPCNAFFPPAAALPTSAPRTVRGPRRDFRLSTPGNHSYKHSLTQANPPTSTHSLRIAPRPAATGPHVILRLHPLPGLSLAIRLRPPPPPPPNRNPIRRRPPHPHGNTSARGHAHPAARAVAVPPRRLLYRSTRRPARAQARPAATQDPARPPAAAAAAADVT
jgi:hypothetical protein